MSIKRYLFLLIGGIVLGVAAIQLLLIALFKQHLNDEIVQKSQQLSTNIIDIALETFDSEEQHFIIKTGESLHKTVRVIKHDGTDPQCTVTESHKTTDGQGKTSNNVVETVAVNCEDKMPLHQLGATFTPEQLQQQRLIWKQKLHQIIEQKHHDKQTVSKFALITDTPDKLGLYPKHFETVSSEQSSSTAIESLTNYMIYLILASAVVALFLALWLSDHFTRPLQKLSQGFASLERGILGVQVEEAGINEYRKTMHSFNQMSARLAQLAESEKMLQQQGHLAELGEVSRGLAHALRNPMHTIGLSVEQLKDPDLPDKLKTKLQDKIQAKIKHIDKTIKALLTLTSAEIQRNDNVPVRSVIQDIMLELRANDPNVTITLDAPKNNQTIKGAESEIRAIIHTLVVNGVEASNHQGEVNIRLTETDEVVNIEVSDQGKGIDSSVKDKLFQPHISSKAEGAGMGLYISNRLATLYYQGKISLVDNPTVGSTATVTLHKGS